MCSGGVSGLSLLEAPAMPHLMRSKERDQEVESPLGAQGRSGKIGLCHMLWITGGDASSDG